MIVRELIQQLNGLPEDSHVMVRRKVIFLPSQDAGDIVAVEQLPIKQVKRDGEIVILVCGGDNGA